MRTDTKTWEPSKRLSIALGAVGDASTVQFRFTPLDATGGWQIDSLYIDPRLSR